MPINKGTYTRLPPVLPLAVSSSSSPSSTPALARWRPPRRALVLCTVGLLALLYTLVGRTGDFAGGTSATEVGKVGVEEVVAVEKPTTGAASGEEGRTDGSGGADEVSPPEEKLDDDFAFSPRLPCNALTVTNQTLPSGRTQSWLSPSPPLARTVPLSARLDAWLAAPLAPYSTWTRFNRQTCSNPSVRRNRNDMHSGASRETWEKMGTELVSDIREELVGVLRKAEREGRFDEWQEEGKKGARGIVWTAGNADTFDRVLVSLRLLRHSYNSTLPATVFHFASETPSPEQLERFAELGAEVVALELSKDEDRNRSKSFFIKGRALTQAPYDEVLMLDSDNIPVRDVEPLFASPEFREMGVVLWPDYFKDQPENGIWAILGVQCRDEWTAEAGQLLIRKSEHLDALILVEHMLQQWRFWFNFSDGDKDLFRYALLALRKRWAVPSAPLAPASWPNPLELGAAHEAQFAGHTMLQFGLPSEERGGGRPRAMFVHANLLKRILPTAGDFNTGNTWGRTLSLRFPSTSPPRSSSSISSSSPPGEKGAAKTPFFVLSADDVANVSPFTGVGIPSSPSISSSSSPPAAQPDVGNYWSTSSPAAARHEVPLWARQRALLARGLTMHFWDAHRGSAYVLAVETGWRDELGSLSLPLSSSSGGEGEGGEGARLWEAEGMGEEEWREWREWVEREREAQCTLDAGVEVPAASSAAAGEGEEGEEGMFVAPPRPATEGDAGEGREKPTVGRESLRSLLLASSSPALSSPSSSADSSTADPSLWPATAGHLVLLPWVDDPDLSGFEERFYGVGGGKASGFGFRRR
ncbi:hypothetical protein JCM8097_002789 [Rhodosporidiobolus ruineniae]